MRAKDLIKVLEQVVKEHGNKHVFIPTTGCDRAVEEVRLWPKDDFLPLTDFTITGEVFFLDGPTMASFIAQGAKRCYLPGYEESENES